MTSTRHFHSPTFGRERLHAGARIPPHRHWNGYITVVLGGGYQEAGLDGRRNLAAADVIVHRRFDAHLDCVAPTGADMINLPLPPGLSLPTAFRIENPDAIARLAESDLVEAAQTLLPVSEVALLADWPDRLAGTLLKSSGQRLQNCAEAMGFAPETLSRGFRAAYGMTPARFRAEARTRRAMELIVGTDAGLAAIAVDCGFSDQPHLTRAIVELTGRPPGQWRKSNSFKKVEQVRS